MCMIADEAVRADRGVALVHDYLLVMRGAERTFEAIAACFPDAQIATLLYDAAGTGGRFAERLIRTSFLQPFAADQRRFRRFAPLLPLAARRLVVDDAGLVISSTSAFAHGVRPAPDAVHISYCHSPLRYVWHEHDRTEQALPAPARPAARAMSRAIRRWDVSAAARVSAYVANSELTRRRIQDFYGRDAAVVHPPVEVNRFTAAPDPRDYFLVVGEVTRHKNIEVALGAAELAGARLKIVGDGPDLVRLRARYPRAEFLGRVSDRHLSELYRGARALIVAAIEEFGITMVEAQAAGRPVIAAADGGALEIVTEGLTGVLVKPRSVDALAQALRATDWEAFDVTRLRASAERFSVTEFRKRFVNAVVAVVGRKTPVARTPNEALARPRRSLGRGSPLPVPTLATRPLPGGSLARSSHWS
jgi:glycosyltransferase involved in cell wall biosynthesis